MKNRKIKIAIYLGLFIVTGVLLMSAIRIRKTGQVQDMKIKIDRLPDGEQMISESMIKRSLRNQYHFNPEGVGIGSVDLHNMEKFLEEISSVQSAKVFIDGKSRLVISIKQRIPVVRIIDQTGAQYYLDAEANRISISPLHTVRVPVFTGKIPPYVSSPLKQHDPMFQRIQFMANYIRDDTFMKSLIEQVHIDEKGEFIAVPKFGKPLIHFGKLENMDELVLKLKTFFKKGLPQYGWDKYQSVYLQYRNQIVARK